ncbi:immunoglobulin kappa light chain [Dicentrarchus labrax]|uniref:Ig-like domain-containing protein n=1 Tax=Dicentrarchus labrax TaxID=13489 RepID=A0A8C4HUT7_DICLA|nr:immunoglobulin kappa light chain [Dicentrarchus labrax]XP_051284759.1 immunoglobulin kappa light chain [Dicentrarchus labrax]
MTSPKLVFCLWTCLFFGEIAQTTYLSSSFNQDRGFISANVGDNITLQCFYESDMVARYYWYKQHLGQKPRLVSTVYVSNKRVDFYDEFKDSPRFSLDTETGKNHLKILDLHISDSAAYYCASSFSVKFEFAEGIIVSVKGSGLKIPASVHQSASESIQPGGSVTLNCTVHTGTCDREHSVYWFKTSEESHPGLIYTHGGRNDQCERKPDTQTHTCVYNLPMQSLDLSHAGTYYCAVVSCGHILFGDGTKLDFEDDEGSRVLVYFLSGALAFNTILVVLLTFFVYFISKRKSCQCRESNGRVSACSTTNAEAHKNEDNLHYAALRVNKASRSRRQRDDAQDQCVYSSVK